MLNMKKFSLLVTALAVSIPWNVANAIPTIEAPEYGTSGYPCYKPSGTCKSGYTLSADGKSCVKDVVRYTTLAECERNNLINECTSDGNGKYIAGNCISLTDASTGACYLSGDSYDCVNDYFTSGCTSIAPSRYVPTGCIAYTQAECEAEYPYDICEKLTRVNCWGPEGGLKYPAAEKSGECDGLWTGSYSMAYNVCGATTVENCQAVYPGFNCQQVEDPTLGTVYVPAGCMSGYTYDNGYCVADVVTYATLAECERNNLVNVCASDGNGKYIATDECTYKKAPNGACYVDSDDLDCRDDEYVATECIHVGGGYYAPQDCQFYTKQECEKYHVFYDCVQLSSHCWRPGGYPVKVPATTTCDGTLTGINAEICLTNTKARCEELYPGYNCVLGGDPSWGSGNDYYAPVGCKEGYTLETTSNHWSNCVSICDDGYTYDNGKCVADETCEDYNVYTDRSACNSACKGDHPLCEPENVTTKSGATITCTVCHPQCDWDDATSCQKYMANSICTADEAGCFHVTSCSDGYTLSDDGTCVADVTCDSGFTLVQGECLPNSCESLGLYTSSLGVSTSAEAPSVSFGDTVTISLASGNTADCSCDYDEMGMHATSSKCTYFANGNGSCSGTTHPYLTQQGIDFVCYKLTCNSGYTLSSTGQCVAKEISSCADVETDSDWTFYYDPNSKVVYAPAKSTSDTFTTSSGSTITCQLACRYDLSSQLYEEFPDATLDTSGICPGALCEGTNYSTKAECDSVYGTNCCEQQTSGCWVNINCWTNPS